MTGPGSGETMRRRDVPLFGLVGRLFSVSRTAVLLLSHRI